MNYGEVSNQVYMRVMDDNVDLLETATWYIDAREGRATGVSFSSLLIFLTLL